MEGVQNATAASRKALQKWQDAIHDNVYSYDLDLIHTIQYWYKDNFEEINHKLIAFGKRIAEELEPLVELNHYPTHLPRIENYDGIGHWVPRIIHHPSYLAAGDIIYGSGLLQHMTQPGEMSLYLSLLFLACTAGEAGHNCPIACTAGMIRVLTKTPDFPLKASYLQKLIEPSFQKNYTGAQFLTEIQGGSDVGLNTTFAKKENNQWRIYGEKWFCSNANADLIFATARFDEKIEGTKGLGLFLIPSLIDNKPNHYIFRRLKQKLGTQTMATAEIDFNGAYAHPMGDLIDGFHLVMKHVLHISRLSNAFCVVAMARRAFFIAYLYATHRVAFSHPIIEYPLVKENLARIKAENTALLAANFAIAHLQDQYDLENSKNVSGSLLLRLFVNMQKYISAKLSVEHIHHALDVLAGNGTIETFSSIPRLLRDCIVCENWEGTHNILHMQILKDIHKYSIDEIYLEYMRETIKLIEEPSRHYKVLFEEKLRELEKEMILFRKLNNALQSLQIREMVDRMIYLFCALSLLFEALNLLKTLGSATKMDCLQFFWMLRIENNPIFLNEKYLALISRIL